MRTVDERLQALGYARPPGDLAATLSDVLYEVESLRARLRAASLTLARVAGDMEQLGRELARPSRGS